MLTLPLFIVALVPSIFAIAPASIFAFVPASICAVAPSISTYEIASLCAHEEEDVWRVAYTDKVPDVFHYYDIAPETNRSSTPRAATEIQTSYGEALGVGRACDDVQERYRKFGRAQERRTHARGRGKGEMGWEDYVGVGVGVGWVGGHAF